MPTHIDDGRVERFATVSKRTRKVSGLCEAYPPHELLANEFELTLEEWKLLYAISDLDKIDEVLESLKIKMAQTIERINEE